MPVPFGQLSTASAFALFALHYLRSSLRMPERHKQLVLYFSCLCNLAVFHDKTRRLNPQYANVAPRLRLIRRRASPGSDESPPPPGAAPLPI